MLSNPAQPVTGANVGGCRCGCTRSFPNEHLRNPDLVRRRDQKDDAAQFYPPLALNLLVPPDALDRDDLGDQQVLGRALQIFHDQSVLRMESVRRPRIAPRSCM